MLAVCSQRTLERKMVFVLFFAMFLYLRLFSNEKKWIAATVEQVRNNCRDS